MGRQEPRTIFALALVVAVLAPMACGDSRGGRPEAGAAGQSGGGQPGVGGRGSPPGCGGSGLGEVSWPTTASIRPVAPLSTATATSQRPTFRWSLGANADGARVQICRDRACAVPLTTFDTTGSSGTPPQALGKGVYFWHARALHGGAPVDGWTPFWELIVGARSAPVDTSWGTTLDVNGDGFADVVVGAPQANGGVGQAYLYLGSACGLETSPRPIGPDNNTLAGFGLFVAGAGDVNGDGYADVIVNGIGRATVYLGGPSGLASSPVITLAAPDARPGSPPGFGVHAGSAGDVNGDGYADFLVGDNYVGRAYLYLGGATGPTASPATILADTSRGAGDFGHSVTGAGDVNGDGFGDVVVGANGAAASSGAVYLYWGGATGLASSPAIVLIGPDGPSGSFGAVSCAGDVNGDGFADIVVGANAVGADYAGRAYVYLGGPDGVGSTPAVTLNGLISGGSFGRYVSDAGDVDGDGFGDVVIGADGEGIAAGVGADGGAGADPGWAYIYLGSAAGITDAPAVTLTGTEAFGGYFGRSVAAAGDVNGDGYSDVLVGADAGGVVQAGRDAGADETIGWAHLYLGSAAGLATSPAVTLAGPEPGSLFGRIVASLEARRPLVHLTARDRGAGLSGKSCSADWSARSRRSRRRMGVGS